MGFTLRYSSAQNATILGVDNAALMPVTEAGANVLVKKLRKTLESHSRTGTLSASLKVTKFDSSGVAVVGPSGTHHKTSGNRKRGKHHGKTGSTSAQEVGFYLEYGTPRMPATHWMSKTVEQSEGEITAAMAAELEKIINK